MQVDAKDLLARNNYSLYACYTGDFQTCEREGREVRKLNPTSEDGFLLIGYAQLGQGLLTEAAQTYQELQKLSTHGASLAASQAACLAFDAFRAQ